MSLRAATLVLTAGLPAVAPPLPLNVPLPAALPAGVVPDFRRAAEMSAPEDFRHMAEISIPPSAPAAPQAAAQLQAAQPPSKPGPTEAQRAFYERVFSGSAPAAPDGVAAQPPTPPEVAGLRADVQTFLAHLAATPTSWRSSAQIGESLARRAEAVAAAGGVSRRIPQGLWGSRIVVDPLDPDLLAQLPRMAETFRLIARTERADFSDFLYSFNVLSGRAATRDAFAADVAWLYGTYRLGR